MERGTSIVSLLHRPGAWLPVVLSLTALGLVLGVAAFVGTTHHAGEGAAARIFQLLLLADAAAIAWFGLRRLPEAPWSALAVIGLQLVAAAVPVAVILMLDG